MQKPPISEIIKACNAFTTESEKMPLEQFETTLDVFLDHMKQCKRRMRDSQPEVIKRKRLKQETMPSCIIEQVETMKKEGLRDAGTKARVLFILVDSPKYVDLGWDENGRDILYHKNKVSDILSDLEYLFGLAGNPSKDIRSWFGRMRTEKATPNTKARKNRGEVFHKKVNSNPAHFCRGLELDKVQTPFEHVGK